MQNVVFSKWACQAPLEFDLGLEITAQTPDLDRGGLPGLLLAAGGSQPFRRRCHGSPPPRQMVRAGARTALSGAGLLYRRGHRGLCQPGVGDEVPRRPRQQGPRLRCRLGQRRHPGGVFVHGAAAFRRDLSDGGRPGAGDDIPLCRTRGQRPRHRPHCKGAGARTRDRPRGGGDRFRDRDRSAHAPDLPPRRARKGGGSSGDARARGSPPAVAERMLFCGHGGGPGFRQLGPTGGRFGALVYGLEHEVAADGILRRDSGRDSGGVVRSSVVACCVGRGYRPGPPPSSCRVTPRSP